MHWQGGRFSSPSQQHMYMEPQAAVAMPDEGGAMLVHSSTQCIDMIQTAVAAALNLPYNQVIARAPPHNPALESSGFSYPA